ncbi:MAG: pyridoxal-phosphate dependent enzyme [Bacteroidetes bacterium]|nr:pyridoxal-phosphate dependent enzyme [Bacteroidota bacterium]
MLHEVPGKEDILLASDRIKPFIHRTAVLTSKAIDSIAGIQIFFKCENFQKAGAFKARGATNAVFSYSDTELANGVATHSSGNHAAALSMAASNRGIPAYIVMPSNSSKVKIAAVESYGGIITFCEPTLMAREETLARVLSKENALEVHPYNNSRIIAGQATACLELIEDSPELDVIMAPVGGGGLLSGTALTSFFFSGHSKVIAAEPAGANDAYQSFYQKKFIPSIDPQTIADGLRTSLGSITFPIILEKVSDILLAGEGDIVSAMKLIWERMKIIVEPSSAVPLAALLNHKKDFRGLKVGIILSGGNVDLSDLPW